MNYKDYSSVHVEKFIKDYTQVNFDSLLESNSFKLIFEKQQAASIMRKNSEVLQGFLFQRANKFKFYTLSNVVTSLKRDELMIMIFGFGGKKIHCQMKFESVRLYKPGRGYEVSFLPVRQVSMHQRVEMSAAAIVNLVPHKFQEQVLFGTHHIRRISGRLNKRSDDYLLCEDCVYDRKILRAKPLFYREIPLFSARMIDISQGGCRLALTGLSTRLINEASSHSLLYIQTSLNWGKLETAIRVLAQIRGFRQFQHKLILHCAFVDELPRIPEKIKYNHYKYTFKLRKPAHLRINNRDFFEAKEMVAVKLPLGIHDIKIRWQGGGISDHRIDLRQKPGQVITLS
ncbi:MAG: hypothetical protein AB8G05_14740 [Oligoflexales bacterium]